MKKIIVVVIILVIVALTDFFLEYPDFGNKEIFFKKSFETRYTYASLDFHNSLADDELLEILDLILIKNDSYCLASYFENKAGRLLKSKHNYRIYFRNGLKNTITKQWEDANKENIFFQELSDITDKIFIIDKKFECAFTFSPIKKVDVKFYIGYDKWIAPMGSSGGVYQIRKIYGKWVLVKSISNWVS